MAERGGPTTQSGITYQNSVAALYLGRLCDSTPRPSQHTVIAVRTEAPAAVDDIVVTYQDGHRTFIQAKENVRDNDAAWVKLWQDFERQFRDTDFQRGEDRLLLHVGEIREEHRALKEICARAASSTNRAEWLSRLSEEQLNLQKRISNLLDQQRSEGEELLVFFKHVEVEIRPLEDIERDMVPYWMPASNKSQIELFRLLRDRVGGAASRRGTFTAEGLRSSLAAESDVTFVLQPDLDTLRELVRECGAGLKQHKHSFGSTGVHLRRAVVDTITNWALQASAGDGQHNVAMLLDRAGMGKTVVARDVLYALEQAGMTVLAIKADQLSGITTAAELQASLPDSVERVLRRLSGEGPVLLLIDQIDALSLSLARDQKALNVVLDLIARARFMPGVRVLLSCRTYDLNNDPRLKNIESGTKFPLTELTDDEVREVIEQLHLPHIEYARLSPATRELLRTPLHLDLFTRAVGEQAAHGTDAQTAPHEIKSLQDLYTLLWQNIVRRPDPQGPPVPDRERAIHLLTEAMNREQRTAIPQSIFSEPEVQHLYTAAQWLASQGILVPTGAPTETVQASAEWTFLHQTFFDYCYAKSFVENRRPLFETVRDGDQGLFARPQIIHVLSYLRGTDPDAYARELSRLLNATPAELRFHLRDHVLRWFRSLPDPSDQEWLIARRLLADPKRRVEFLGVAQGNVGWFDRLKEMLAHNLATRPDETLDQETIPFLSSMLNLAQAEVVTMLRPYRGRSEQWDRRIRRVIRSVRNWQTEEAVALYEEMFQGVPAAEIKRYHELDDLAKVHPRVGCRLLRIAFDRVLDEQTQADEAGGGSNVWHLDLSHALEVYNGSTIAEAFRAVTKAEPKYFLETMLPWLERVLNLKRPLEDDPFFFTPDALSSAWYGPPYVVRRLLNDAFINALTELARTTPADFRRVASRFAALPYTTPQRYLAHTYSNVAELFPEEALAFLTSDQRRLDLGDHEQYDTRQLIKAVVPHLPAAQLARLETAILSYQPIKKYRGRHALRWSGLERLYLLQCLPAERLTRRGAEALRELERKFPGKRASENPSTIRGGAVGPPIPGERAKKMSDDAWLRAMAKYRGRVQHKEFLKGGAMELAAVLQRQVQAEPERFYDLAMRVPVETDQPYLRAFINGLAESSAPADKMFNVIRRCAPVAERDTRSAISRALQKRVTDGIPEDLINLLESYVRGPADEDETWWRKDEERNRAEGREVYLSGGPYNGYLNSVRGSAFGTLMRALDQTGGERATRRKWELIELIAGDESTALRAGAIEELLSLLHSEHERVLTTFERLVSGHPALIRSYHTDDFLYYGFYQHYFRIKPYIMAMMNEAQEDVRQRGAELACIAAISSRALESVEAERDARALAEAAITGPPPWRRGAARVYAVNVGSDSSTVCVEGLLRLLDDEDEQVQSFVSEPFRSLREEHVYSLRGFIEAYASSRSLHSGLLEFAEYLWAHGPLDPPWALSVVEKVLGNRQGEQSELQYAGGEELIRLVLRVYTDPTVDDPTRARAMDVFDRLMSELRGPAQMVLRDWDRR
jgi:hypothetical protein